MTPSTNNDRLLNSSTSTHKSAHKAEPEQKKVKTPGFFEKLFGSSTKTTTVHKTESSLPSTGGKKIVHSPCTAKAVKDAKLPKMTKNAVLAIAEQYDREVTQVIAKLESEISELDRKNEVLTKAIKADEKALEADKKALETYKAQQAQTDRVNTQVKIINGVTFLETVQSLFPIDKSNPDYKQHVQKLSIDLFDKYLSSEDQMLIIKKPAGYDIKLLSVDSIIKCMIDNQNDNVDIQSDFSRFTEIIDGQIPKLARYLEDSANDGKIKSAVIKIAIPLSQADIQSLASLKLQKVVLQLNPETTTKLREIMG